MSIDIDWDTLTTGPEGTELADSIRDFIHDKFQQVQLPRFIRSVHVHSFDFGKECPVVELKDISDPLPEFYEDEEGDSDEDHEEADEDQEREEGVAESLRRPPPTDTQHSINDAAKFTKPTYIDTYLPNLRSGFINPQDRTTTGTTPLLSRSGTPGIPGGTSNFSYFHLPLSSAGLSGTQSPLAGVATPFSPAVWHEQQQQQHLPSSSLKRSERHPSFPNPGSRPLTAGVLPYTNPASPTCSPPLSYQAAAAAAPQDPASNDRSQDLQITLHISYTGSLSLSLTAEILLDYPMPSFVGIPLKLQITGLSFDGVGLVAYLRQSDGRNKVHFCFLGGEDARVMAGDDGGDGDGGGDRGDGAVGDKVRDRGGDKLGGLLKEIRVESEIGRQENGKQVLKNVGKVEKFVLEQVRRIFEDEFVWPSFWTFLV